MDVVLFLVAVIAGLALIDRVLTWAEGRGWVYWRRKKRGSGWGNVMGALDAIYNPARKHQQAEVRRIQGFRDAEDDGAPPSLSASRRSVGR